VSSTPINGFTRVFRPVSRIVALVCGWWLMLFSLLTAIEIVGRKLFNFSLQGIDEIGGYTLAVVSTAGFSQALFFRGHTRIDTLLSRLPPWPLAFLNTLAAVSLAAMAVFAAARGWTELRTSVELMSRSSSPLQTPLWVPQGLWFAGLGFFAVVSGVLGLHAVMLFFADHDRVNRLYGPQTLKEEIEQELGAQAERRRTRP